MARRVGKRKRVIVDAGLLGEQITDVVEGPRSKPIVIRSWKQWVKHFGGASAPDVAQAVRAYFSADTETTMTRVTARERTVGDVIRAAVDQGLELDFRFVPLTAAEKRKGSKRLEADVFGPVLEQLGLLTEDEMQALMMSKTTKMQLVEQLTIARKEIAKLRAQVQDLELSARDTDQAASLLAERFAASVARRDTATDAAEHQMEITAKVERLLRRIAGAHRLLIVVAEGEAISRGVAGGLGEVLSDLDFCKAVEDAREVNARQVVGFHGAADALALVRRLGAGQGIVPGREQPL